MSNWYVDKGLAILVEQIKTLYPGITVGTIGDKNHQNTTSDHNPDPDGSVDAADFMLGTAFTKNNAQALVDSLVQNRDERIAYIIWNKRICSSTVSPWTWRPYSGSNPHTDHVHISVNDSHHSNLSRWNIELKKHIYQDLSTHSIATLTYGDDDRDYAGWWMVTRLQKMLGVKADGIYGPITASAVRKAIGRGDGHSVGKSEWEQIYGLSRK